MVARIQTIPINLNRGVNSGANKTPQCVPIMGFRVSLDENEIIMLPKLPSRLISAGEWSPLCCKLC